jgi:hypothetical protein
MCHEQWWVERRMRQAKESRDVWPFREPVQPEDRRRPRASSEAGGRQHQPGARPVRQRRPIAKDPRDQP